MLADDQVTATLVPSRMQKNVAQRQSNVSRRSDYVISAMFLFLAVPQ
jgi:hypothetical protein